MGFKAFTVLLLTLYTVVNISGQLLLPAGFEFRDLLLLTKFNFSLNTLHKASADQSRNVFLSPHSLYQILTVAYLSASGATEVSLKSALQIPTGWSQFKVQKSYVFKKYFGRDCQPNNVSASYEYVAANRLYIAADSNVRQCMANLFANEVKRVDFAANSTAAVVQINGWVHKATKGHISDLISVNGIDARTKLLLVNAVYFKGLWRSKFDPANSKEDTFHGSKNSPVYFMRQTDYFPYVSSGALSADVVELPYAGDNVSMFIFLPFTEANSQSANTDGIETVLKNMMDIANILLIETIFYDGLDVEEVEVIIPRFSVEKQLDVTSLFEAIGAGGLLQPSADLSRLFEEADVHLSSAVHTAKIEVDEEGTTAAAATAVIVNRFAFSPVVFNANRPFVYLIYDKPSESMVFAGVYRSPTETG